VTDEPSSLPRWKLFGERTLYDNPWVQLVQVEVQPPGGNRFWHHVVRLQPVAVAVVLDDEARVLMLRRHRFVADTVCWELPGGIVGPNEHPAVAALREAEEETGWRPTGKPEHLATLQPMPGMVDAPHSIYVMRGATYIGTPTDAEEAGHVAWLPVADLPALIHKGAVAGTGTWIGLLHLLASGNRQS
jgi:8-oxo-dGTP pyrophosphatase MutT (NUDIX family)